MDDTWSNQTLGDGMMSYLDNQDLVAEKLHEGGTCLNYYCCCF